MPITLTAILGIKVLATTIMKLIIKALILRPIYSAVFCLIQLPVFTIITAIFKRLLRELLPLNFLREVMKLKLIQSLNGPAAAAENLKSIWKTDFLTGDRNN